MRPREIQDSKGRRERERFRINERDLEDSWKKLEKSKTFWGRKGDEETYKGILWPTETFWGEIEMRLGWGFFKNLYILITLINL